MKLPVSVLATTALSGAALWSPLLAAATVAVIATLIAVRALTADPLTVRTSRRR